MLSHKELLFRCHYDPETGIFTWLNPNYQKSRRGKPAGSKKKDGYIIVTIHGKGYYTGPLAWFYMTGNWPESDVDHKDRNKSNNRWSNLRLATVAQNAANRNKSILNVSGYRGVIRVRSWWEANIKVSGVVKRLGHYVGKEAAAIAYDCGAYKHFGEYANLNFPTCVGRDWILV